MRVAWRRVDTGANIGTAPIAYRFVGRTYVAVALGGGGMGGAARRDAVRAWVLTAPARG